MVVKHADEPIFALASMGKSASHTRVALEQKVEPSYHMVADGIGTTKKSLLQTPVLGVGAPSPHFTRRARASLRSKMVGL
jgi:hypothetical protein